MWRAAASCRAIRDFFATNFTELQGTHTLNAASINARSHSFVRFSLCLTLRQSACDPKIQNNRQIKARNQRVCG
jgi:hypothetical protein